MSTPNADLGDALAAAGIPVETVRMVGGALAVAYLATATPAQVAQGESIRAAFDPSDAAQVVRDTAASIALAKGTFQDATSEFGRDLRGVALVTMDEVNILRSWITSFKAAVAGAATLAALKTAVAALPDVPQRNAIQAKSAVVSRLDTSDAD